MWICSICTNICTLTKIYKPILAGYYDVSLSDSMTRTSDMLAGAQKRGCALCKWGAF